MLVVFGVAHYVGSFPIVARGHNWGWLVPFLSSNLFPLGNVFGKTPFYVS